MADFKSLVIGCGFIPGGAPAVALHQVDATDDSVEFIFQAPKATTITKLGCYYGLRTGTPPTYRISLQGVANTGRADGIIKNSTNCFSTFTPPATTGWDNSIKRTGDSGFAALGATYACSRGEWLAVVIDYSSGTIDASNRSSFASWWTTNWQGPLTAYGIQVAATTPTRNNGTPAVLYEDGTDVFGWPILSGTLTSYSDATNPDEHGMQFQLSSGWCSSYKLKGIRWWGRTPAAGSTITVTLFNNVAAVDPTNVLQQIVVDTDFWSTNAQNNWQQILFTETTLATLSAGTNYWIGLKAGTGAAISVVDFTVSSANDLSAFPGGTLFQYATRNDGGAFTVTSTTRPCIELIIDDMTAPAGGVIFPRTMSGGFA